MDWEFIQTQQMRLEFAILLPDLLPHSWELEPDTQSTTSILSSSGNIIRNCPYLHSLCLQHYKIICKDKKFEKKTLHDDFPILRVFQRMRIHLGQWNYVPLGCDVDDVGEGKQMKTSNEGLNVQIDLIDMSYVKGSSYPLGLIVSQVNLGEIGLIGYLNLTHAFSRDVSRPGFTDLIISVILLPCLKSLNISYNRLRPEVLVCILRGGLIPDECQLEYLDISGNCCNGTCGRVLANFLTSQQCNLKTLKMNECSMNAGRSNNTAIAGMKQEIIRKLSSVDTHSQMETNIGTQVNMSLETLEIGDNPREDENLDTYNFLFGKFTKLSTLKLAQLVIKDEGVATQVMDSLFACHNLCSLCL